MNLQIEISDPTFNSYFTGIPIGKVYKVILNDVDYADTSATDRLLYFTCQTLKHYGASQKIFLPTMTGGKGSYQGLNRVFYFDSNPSTNFGITLYDSSTDQPVTLIDHLVLNFYVEEME